MYSETDQIETLDALDALPIKTVILERTTLTAYQKCGRTDWDGDAREWHSGQIDLPVTVLWLPRVIVPHEHRWVSEQAMNAATETATCVGCGATLEEESA